MAELLKEWPNPKIYLELSVFNAFKTANRAKKKQNILHVINE